MFQQAQDWFKRKLQSSAKASAGGEVVNPCCSQATVHIAFRGKSDDRMYISYNRNWQEVRYYKANGLRVFCAACRRRLV